MALFGKEALTSAIGSSGFSSAVGGISGAIGSAIGGKNTTGVGSAMQSLGSIASAIPGPYGAVASAALNIGGGLVNAAFGSSLNEEFINDKEAEMSGVLSSTSNATDIEGFLSDFSNRETVADFSKDDVGSDGWFSSKAKEKYEQMQKAKKIANSTAERNFANQGENINKANLNQLMYNVAADGGNLRRLNSYFNNGVSFIGNGGSHESNPMEGVPMGIDFTGTPNLVEEGETIWNNYVFSNRLKANKGLLDNMNLPTKYKKKTFSEIAEDINKESEERPNDPISKNGLDAMMTRLQTAQEIVRQKNRNRKNEYANGGRVNKFKGDEATTTDTQNLGIDTSNKWEYPTWLRYAPVAGNVYGVLSNIFSSPDYTAPDIITRNAYKAGETIGISYKPISSYLEYRPFDTDYYINKLNANTAADRRAIANSANGNLGALMSGLTILSSKNSEGISGLARQAAEYNLTQKKQIAEFNRGTDAMNAEMGLKAAMANEEARQKAAATRLAGVQQASALREKIDTARSNALSSNLSNLFTSLGNVGIDAYNRSDRDKTISTSIAPLSEQMKPQEWDISKWTKYRSFEDFLKNNNKSE